MEKLLGSILVVIAGGGIGFYVAHLFKYRLQELMELQRIIVLLQSEIRYNVTPLPEAFLNISRKTSMPFSIIFRNMGEELMELNGQSFLQIWKGGVGNIAEKTTLSLSDLRNLDTLGKSLGYLDKETQLNAIELYLEQMDFAINNLQSNLNKKMNLSRYLGFVGGMILVIILI